MRVGGGGGGKSGRRPMHIGSPASFPAIEQRPAPDHAPACACSAHSALGHQT